MKPAHEELPCGHPDSIRPGDQAKVMEVLADAAEALHAPETREEVWEPLREVADRHGLADEEAVALAHVLAHVAIKAVEAYAQLTEMSPIIHAIAAAAQRLAEEQPEPPADPRVN